MFAISKDGEASIRFMRRSIIRSRRTTDDTLDGLVDAVVTVTDGDGDVDVDEFGIGDKLAGGYRGFGMVLTRRR